MRSSAALPGLLRVEAALACLGVQRPDRVRGRWAGSTRATSGGASEGAAGAVARAAPAGSPPTAGSAAASPARCGARRGTTVRTESPMPTVGSRRMAWGEAGRPEMRVPRRLRLGGAVGERANEASNVEPESVVGRAPRRRGRCRARGPDDRGCHRRRARGSAATGLSRSPGGASQGRTAAAERRSGAPRPPRRRSPRPAARWASAPAPSGGASEGCRAPRPARSSGRRRAARPGCPGAPARRHPAPSIHPTDCRLPPRTSYGSPGCYSLGHGGAARSDEGSMCARLNMDLERRLLRDMGRAIGNHRLIEDGRSDPGGHVWRQG